MESIGTIRGEYASMDESVKVSRQITRGVHVIMGFSTRDYGSPDYANYNRRINEARIAIGYSPGDVPLRVW